MKTIINAYGKVIISSIIGLVVVASVITGIRYWYEKNYPLLQDDEILVYEINQSVPVLLVERIEIEAVDVEEGQGSVGIEVHDFLQYVVAYENGNSSKELPVTIIGLESVDLENKGIYQIICEVQNDMGETFSKKATVLVY